MHQCNKDRDAYSVRASSYHLIAAKINSPLTNKLLFFYNELNEHLRSAPRAISEYRIALQTKTMKQEQQSCPANRSSCPRNSSNTQSAVASLLEDTLVDSLKRENAVKRIQDVCTTENNSFLAFCMYLRYRQVILRLQRTVPSRKIQKELLEHLDQLGTEIREKYLQGRTRNQNRENNFRNVCRNMHGRWEWAPPTNLSDMKPFVDGCYKAWQKTNSLSAYSEFPEWGNAMLEVLQMIQSPALENKFDTACAEYQKYNN